VRTKVFGKEGTEAMSVTDELLRNNERYAESFGKGDLPLPRRRAWPWSPAWTRD
jgi:hypothetical protein